LYAKKWTQKKNLERLIGSVPSRLPQAQKEWRKMSSSLLLDMLPGVLIQAWDNPTAAWIFCGRDSIWWG
jgi:hypothetical protein